MTDSEKLKAYEDMRENVIDRFNIASEKMDKLKVKKSRLPTSSL